MRLGLSCLALVMLTYREKLFTKATNTNKQKSNNKIYIDFITEAKEGNKLIPTLTGK